MTDNASATGAGGDQRNETASRGGEAAASLASDLQDAAKSAGDSVKRHAEELAGHVGYELGRTAEEQKLRGVDALRGFSRAIYTAADELDRQSPGVARSARDAAARLDGLSENLGSRDVNALIDAASAFARAQPAVFLGGAVAAGFALARFLRSSAPSAR